MAGQATGIEDTPQNSTTNSSDMEKPARYKSKNEKQAAKPKTTKKRNQSDGPTCSMFLSEITRKLAAKRRRAEDSPKNIVQKIIESITNALPIKFFKKTPERRFSPIKMESLATELTPNDAEYIPPTKVKSEHIQKHVLEMATTSDNMGFKMPKMPLIDSKVIKMAIEKRRRTVTQDVSMNTSEEYDLASELVKHVSTLRKISLIAEEFNQKTAKNLKEIVDSVQEDLVKKLKEIQAEQKAAAQATQVQEETKEDLEKEE